MIDPNSLRDIVVLRTSPLFCLFIVHCTQGYKRVVDFFFQRVPAKCVILHTMVWYVATLTVLSAAWRLGNFYYAGQSFACLYTNTSDSLINEFIDNITGPLHFQLFRSSDAYDQIAMYSDSLLPAWHIYDKRADGETMPRSVYFKDGIQDLWQYDANFETVFENSQLGYIAYYVNNFAQGGFYRMFTMTIDPQEQSSLSAGQYNAMREPFLCIPMDSFALMQTYTHINCNTSDTQCTPYLQSVANPDFIFDFRDDAAECQSCMYHGITPLVLGQRCVAVNGHCRLEGTLVECFVALSTSVCEGPSFCPDLNPSQCGTFGLGFGCSLVATVPESCHNPLPPSPPFVSPPRPPPNLPLPLSPPPRLGLIAS